MKYRVNKLSVVLLDSDKDRGLNTVAYNWQTNELMAIRPKEYAILKYVEDHNGVIDEEVQSAGFDQGLVDELVKKGILETK